MCLTTPIRSRQPRSWPPEDSASPGRPTAHIVVYCTRNHSSWKNWSLKRPAMPPATDQPPLEWASSSVIISCSRTKPPCGTPLTAAPSLLHGGPSGEGLRLNPTVLSDIAHDDAAVKDEIFGPVIAALQVPDYEAGLAAINDSRYGLTAGICADSLAKSTDFAQRAQAGVIKINRPTAGLDLNVPFGGVKDSSTNTSVNRAAPPWTSLPGAKPSTPAADRHPTDLETSIDQIRPLRIRD